MIGRATSIKPARSVEKLSGRRHLQRFFSALTRIVHITSRAGRVCIGSAAVFVAAAPPAEADDGQPPPSALARPAPPTRGSPRISRDASRAASRSTKASTEAWGGAIFMQWGEAAIFRVEVAYSPDAESANQGFPLGIYVSDGLMF